MNTVIVFLLFALGLVLIIKGGDWFVDAASWIAKVSGIPPFIIGATIVSLATTLPEILVSVMAAAQGNVEMATGNAIGSVTVNTGLILGISIIFMPVAINRKKYLPKSLILISAIVLLWLTSLSAELNVWGAAALIVVFGVFIFENIREAKLESTSTQRPQKPDKATVFKNIALFVVGAACIVIGSRLLVDNGTIIAEDIFKVDPRIVSLTMVAIGTSLPELVTTITAIVKKQSSLSVGNILGANIIDILLILPLCSFISGGSLPVAQSTLMIDMPILFVITLIALVPALIGKRLYRAQGIITAVLYIGYVVYICLV